MRKTILLWMLVFVSVIALGLLIMRLIIPPRPNHSGYDQGTDIPVSLSQPTGIVVRTETEGGQMFFDSSIISLRVGEKKEISLMVEPRNHMIDGADAVFSYDPAVVSVSDITNKSLFSQLIRSTIDSREGIVRVTGFSPATSSLSDQPMTFFSFVVTGKSRGVSNISIAHESGRSDMSTIVEKGTSKNVLSHVTGMKIQVSP